jgi:hypothetical protein
LYTKTQIKALNTKAIIHKAQKINTKKSYLQAAKTNHLKTNNSPNNTNSNDIEARFTRVEKLLEVALFTLQHILKKGEEQEELKNLQSSIKEREKVNTHTPSKKEKNKTNPLLKTPYNNLFTSIHAPTKLNSNLPPPIKDNSVSIATEMRMSKLKTLMETMINAINNCDIHSKVSNKTAMKTDNTNFQLNQ